MNMPDAVQLSGVYKQFGQTPVVNDISLNLKRGEFFSLLGPSGCGKSTLLRMIAGFEQPTQGEITIGGTSVAGTPANKRPTNMVFQNYAIFPHLNVQDNVAFGLRRSNLTRRKISEKVQKTLKTVGLPGLGKRRAGELSGGQRQRVALARALILEPEVLLLDEPLSALDKKLREHMQIELRRLQRSVGITFLLVTHDQHEAMTMSDRCGVMFDGQLEQVDTPTRLYDQPASKRVANFIGGINFLDGCVEEVGTDTVKIMVDGFGPVVMPVSNTPLHAGQDVTLGVRPERVYLDYTIPDAADIAATATVKDIAFYGESIHYFLDIDNREQSITASVANFHQMQRFNEGDCVHVALTGQSMVMLP